MKLEQHIRESNAIEGYEHAGLHAKNSELAARLVLLAAKEDQVLHPHTFRHTCATRLLVAGMQEADVRVLLGWSRNSRMLERYTQSGATERALEARAKLQLL